ncbi:tartrate dehydrogenase [Fulvivirga sedimenti]|uniref:D-malate dehydrogenase (decarboxylating) n=1 Tax=Fulvivirga sedimenti TaxID=2879465 RepID=A0A9X1HW39_9BACT|nr:tartrate dehydrogenase [Fulvivirga sedimenti]MCA6078936.1 tartrate dehydrogenase [Fulvivirga sedimenti]
MKYKLAVIPGDGIGNEVIPASLEVLNSLSAKCGFELEYQHFDYSCEYYRKTGKMMPEDGIDRLGQSDAIFLGAVGYPGVPDHISLWGLLIPIRRAFHQYVNIRPVRLLKGIESPLRSPGEIDFIIVRENNEGEYSNVGGRIHEGTPFETVVQESIFTRMGVDRVMNYAFTLAEKRRKKIASATKSNGIIHTMTYWDERFEALSMNFPEIEKSKFHIDILCAQFVQHPDWFDVVVASNLFGDILSDLGPAVVGGLGIAPGANINPEKEFPSMFEPVHGSAPDIAGKNTANPIAAFWTAQMMLEHLGEKEAADMLMGTIESLTAEGKVLTRDLGGTASTSDVTKEILRLISKQ